MFKDNLKILLHKQSLFVFVLKILGALSRHSVFDGIIQNSTLVLAKLNVRIIGPKSSTNARGLAEQWKAMMPADGQEFFKITSVTKDTAYTEIHLHCPLRGSGDLKACHKLMNYDRQLMKSIGGQLVVLSSQSNSGQSFCQLAIRKSNQSTTDLTPAHKA
ncbi:MAG: hypothetical protein ACON4B_07800 [Flavobacteriaceae bacterium]